MSDGGGRLEKFGPFWDNANSRIYTGIYVHAFVAGAYTVAKNFWINEDKSTVVTWRQEAGTTGEVFGYFDGTYNIEIRASDNTTVIAQYPNFNISRQLDGVLRNNTSYPLVSMNNTWMLALKKDGSDNFEEIGVNNGTSFITLIKHAKNYIANLFSDIITKSPVADIRYYMDGLSGRPTLAAWNAAQDTTSIISVFTAVFTDGNRVRLPKGTYFFDVNSVDLFDVEKHIEFMDGAMLKAANGVQVNGNMCTVSGNLTKHFDHPDYDTQWITSTSYNVGDIIQFEWGRYYKCSIAHTSGTWLTDKQAGKFAIFHPFQWFHREEGDLFVYPEWFGAKADNSTLCSRPFAKALSCASVMASYKLIQSGGSLINGSYLLEHPLVVLNGRTLSSGLGYRNHALLRIHGPSWIGGDLGISSEEFSTSQAQVMGYASFENLRFEIEGIINVNFEWTKFYFLETSYFRQISWLYIGTNSIKQVCYMYGGPVRINDLNIGYGDNGTVADYPFFINATHGFNVRNINYKQQSAAKGLKIRAGRYTDIQGIFIETPPSDNNEAQVLIEMSGDSNGVIGNFNISRNPSSGTEGLMMEIISEPLLSSFNANLSIRDVFFHPHDSGGGISENLLKINGTVWTRSQLQSVLTDNVKIAEISGDTFRMSGTKNHHKDGPVNSSWHFDSIADAATESIHFAPILQAGTNAHTSQAWCGLIMISARGNPSVLGYLAFVSMQQRTTNLYDSNVTELAGLASWSTTWNGTTARWDITNNSGVTATEVIISFINQGPNIFIQ